MGTGVAGIVYGRNIIQHDDPGAMVRALSAVVHHDATPQAAAEELALVVGPSAARARRPPQGGDFPERRLHRIGLR